MRAEFSDIVTTNGLGWQVAKWSGLVIGVVVAVGVARAVKAATISVADEEFARMLDRGDLPGIGHHPGHHSSLSTVHPSLRVSASEPRARVG